MIEVLLGMERVEAALGRMLAQEVIAMGVNHRRDQAVRMI